MVLFRNENNRSDFSVLKIEKKSLNNLIKQVGGSESGTGKEKDNKIKIQMLLRVNFLKIVC